MTSPHAKARRLGTTLTCVAAGLLVAVVSGSADIQLSDSLPALEALAEAVLAVSLFCAGLKFSGPLDWKTWRVPLALGLVTLPVTVALVAGAASVFLGMPMREALLLGAILGPTDSMLASNLEVQTGRGQATRFALAAEGALGACLGFPVLLFALGLNGSHALGPLALRWIAVDVGWGLLSGVACGWLAGRLIVRGIGRFGSRGPIGQRGSIGAAELAWLAGALVIACAAAYLLEANAFAAALAAGAAIARAGTVSLPAGVAAKRAATLATGAARIERPVELTFLVALGALLGASVIHAALILFALLVLIAVRPLAAGLAFGAPGAEGPERRIVAWFGMRGAPSLCYLLFAFDQNLSAPLAGDLLAATVCVLAVSVALHGLTALSLGNRPAGEPS